MCLVSTTQLTQTLQNTKQSQLKKSSVVSFLITLLLAAAVSIQGNEPVKDTAGNSLKPGQQYFIQPVKNNGSGLVPAAIQLIPLCPLGIDQTLLPNQPGQPVSFALPVGVEEVFTTSSVVNIEFQSNIWLFCNEFSKLWKVNDSSSAAKEPAIIIAGTPGERNSQFKIEKAGEGANTYKLTSFTGAGTVGAIPGIFLAPQLVLTNDADKTVLVKFKKVGDATTAATSASRVEKLGLRMFPIM